MSDSINAIDVAYETEISIENKSTEQLTIEANVQYKQAESLAAMSMAMLADVGRKIAEIKERIPHGEFENWCADNLVFSKRQAEQYMKLASKVDDKNSIFSKTQTFADIGISRVWALLAAPEEVAAEVMETQDVTAMTVRELKEEISRLKREKEEAEDRADRAELSLAGPDEEELADARNAIEHLNEKLETTEREFKEREEELEQSVKNSLDRESEIQAKLDKAKKDLKKQKEKLKELEAAKDEEIQKRLTEAGAEIEEKARADAQKEAENALREREAAIQSLEAQVSALEAEKAKLSDTALMEFKVYVDQLQDIYYKLNDMITEECLTNEEVGAKMKGALQTVIGGWRP